MEVVSGKYSRFVALSYHTNALASVSNPASSSPFVQRVWIALEMKGIPYQYIEIDPYEKPQALLEVNPRGLVPALRHGDWGCYESTVIMEYVWNHLISYIFNVALRDANRTCVA